MDGNDRREHIRTAMSAKVKVVHEELGEFIFSTRDISDGGVFIVVDTEPFAPNLGDTVTVQVQGLPVPARYLKWWSCAKPMTGTASSLIKMVTDRRIECPCRG